MNPKTKPDPKGKTPRQPIRLTKSDNLLISVILSQGKVATRTEAVRIGLILAAQQYGNIYGLLPSIFKPTKKLNPKESKPNKKK